MDSCIIRRRTNITGKESRSAWFLGMVFGLALLLGLTPLLCIGAERGSNKVAFSLSASNERLDAVLDKISSASGYRISVNEGWRNKVITLRLENVTVEEGLKTLIEVLGRPSHLLLYDEKQKKIEIVMIPGASGGSVAETVPPRTPRQIGPSSAERVSPPTRSIPRRIRQRVIPPPSAPEEVQQPEREETPKEQSEVDTKTGDAPDEKSDSPEEVTPDSKQKGGAERKRKPADSLEDRPAS